MKVAGIHEKNCSFEKTQNREEFVAKWIRSGIGQLESHMNKKEI